ncbi:MAG TPA: amidohydrolase family protein [Thermoanaerobaculia bacterium]|jgi:imidazolonepropionase-like amidohydrolase
MRIDRAHALLACLLLAAACAPAGVVIQHVNVVDVANARIVPDQTVVVKGGGRRRVDGRGLYVMPGLWDMHAHLWEHERTPALFLANGVTGIRDMGSDLAATVALRNAISKGAKPGPRIVTAGPVLDGPRKESAQFRVTVATPADAARAVSDAESGGADFIKVYHFLSREAYLAIAREAKQRGLAFAGHVPPSITAEDAVRAGQASIEHLYTTRERLMKDANDPTLAATCALFAKSMTWQTPTLTIYRSVAFRDTPNDPFVPDVYERYLTPEMRAQWEADMPRRNLTPDQAAKLAASYANLQAGVRAMHAAGVPLLAGSDNGIKFVYAGFGLHDELEALVAAGLTPAEALRAATVNAWEYLGKTLPRGAADDVVLLRANPLDDIRNARQIDGVIANGRYYDRATLDALLARAAVR